MKFYEVYCDGHSTFFANKPDALREAKAITSASNWGFVTVERITIRPPTKKLILNMLNQHGYVKSRELILKIDEDTTYEEK